MDRFGVIAKFIMICSSKRNLKMEGVVVAGRICGVSEVIWVSMVGQTYCVKSPLLAPVATRGFTRDLT